MAQINKVMENLSFDFWNYAQLVHNKQNKKSVLRDVNDLHDVIEFSMNEYEWMNE